MVETGYNLRMDPISELLTRRVNAIFPDKQEFEKILMSGKKIRLYQGFDPSKPNLHIGHLVGLLQLKMFQDLGHEVIFLIGDFTGMIGDPTDKKAARTKLTEAEVKANAQTYRDQAGKILRFEGENAAHIEYNSTWLSRLTFADILELSGSFTIQQLLERDMFQERLKQNKPIYLHEFLYPLMVTYDAIAMKVDLEVGGNDQLFNMTVGRHLVKEKTGINKYALTTKLLTDKDGNKIGKTSGNAINLFDPPQELFGQLMSLPDDVIINAFTLATTVTMDEIKSYSKQIIEDPMGVKKSLAYEIVKMIHGNQEAENAISHFTSTIQAKEVPTDIPSISISAESIRLIDLMKHLELGESGGQIKRVIEQGGFEYNGNKMSDYNQPIIPKSGDIIKFGKRTYRKIVCN
jgi:tyrosyl-tRNA synthetase